MVPHAACVCQVIMARVKSTTGARNVSGVPTMADVAELSGLSRFPVSKVLNGSPGVSEKTKALVFETCERLSFVTNQHAASLAKGGPRLMGLVVISRAPAMARAYGIDAPFLLHRKRLHARLARRAVASSTATSKTGCRTVPAGQGDRRRQQH